MQAQHSTKKGQFSFVRRLGLLQYRAGMRVEAEEVARGRVILASLLGMCQRDEHLRLVVVHENRRNDVVG